MPVNSAWPEPFDHGFRKPVYCGGPQLTLFCWVGRSSSLLAQQQGALWWGCLLSLPDSSLQGYFHLVAWVPPSLPHFLEDPCCLENQPHRLHLALMECVCSLSSKPFLCLP